MPVQSFKVYVKQGFLKIKFNTKNVDLASALSISDISINYIDPDGDEGSFTGNTSIEHASGGSKVVWQLQNDTILKAGWWTFQPEFLVDGLQATCDKKQVRFDERLHDEN
jgi:hypothetical protein